MRSAGYLTRWLSLSSSSCLLALTLRADSRLAMRLRMTRRCSGSRSGEKGSPEYAIGRPNLPLDLAILQIGTYKYMPVCAGTCDTAKLQAQQVKNFLSDA